MGKGLGLEGIRESVVEPNVERNKEVGRVMKRICELRYWEINMGQLGSNLEH